MRPLLDMTNNCLTPVSLHPLLSNVHSGCTTSWIRILSGIKTNYPQVEVFSNFDSLTTCNTVLCSSEALSKLSCNYAYKRLKYCHTDGSNLDVTLCLKSNMSLKVKCCIFTWTFAKTKQLINRVKNIYQKSIYSMHKRIRWYETCYE